MFAKYVNNQQREGQAVNNDINKIVVVKYSMNRTYLCVSWSWRRNFFPYCFKICNKRKWQPWIVAVYWSLERQMHCNCRKHIQCEGPEVRCWFWSLQRKMYAKYIKKSTTWGSVCIQRNKQNSSSKILNESHSPLCWFITKMQCLPVFLENMW